MGLPNSTYCTYLGQFGLQGGRCKALDWIWNLVFEICFAYKWQIT